MIEQKKINKYQFCINSIFFIGILFFLLAIAMLLVAFGWFGIGVKIKEEWQKENCTITNNTIETFSNTYSVIYRLVSSVNYLDESGRPNLHKAALTSYRNAWVTENQVQGLIDKYRVDSSFSCYCPPKPNDFNKLDQSKPFNYVILDFDIRDIEYLVKYYYLLIYLSIGLLIVLPFLLGPTTYIYVKTFCFRRRYNKF
eukprot:TRINITY_DN17426_c0_g1_i1.p1 TRINITY_DN17426_c0_g1~~TRINITY_DN17426_c0_g1_i1.p1  ORF type:complete len:198 (+),score=24.76 TRINITY_DN17426_c0_g1_i1:1-594(+)